MMWSLVSCTMPWIPVDRDNAESLSNSPIVDHFPYEIAIIGAIPHW